MPKRGFTLVELSIVLVIIGLLVGGVLAGQELILVSKRQKVINMWEDMNVSANTFKTKYNALPGDFRKAANFSLGGNGDGNGHIFAAHPAAMSFSHHPGSNVEPCNFFAHLSAAQLIKQNVSSCPVNTTIESVAPVLPFNEKTHYAVSAPCSPYNCMIPSTIGHFFWTNGMYNGGTSVIFSHSTAYHMSEAPFTPQDTFWLDSKLDDGKAIQGSFVIIANSGVADNSHRCVDTAQSNEYDLTITSRDCHARMRTAF